MSAAVGDWIIGFRSRVPGHVVYAMQVTERISLGDYWDDERFLDRRPGNSPFPDNIYRVGATGQLVQVPNHVHQAKHAARDISGQFVLLGSRFWYFGKESVPIPTELIHLVHSSVGHAVEKHRRPTDVQHLQRWLDTWAVGRLGDPIDAKAFSEENLQPLTPDPNPAILNASPLAGVRAMGGCAPARERPRPSPISSEPKGEMEIAVGPRRLVLSRKGFDGGYGGMPSPILPDGRLVPLPIPSQHDEFRMEHLRDKGGHLESLLQDLSSGRHSLKTHIHLDPDLERRSDLRLPGWRPSLGQSGTAQSHLSTQNVGVGDVFLFFGWFRQVERVRAKWRYAPKAPNRHVLFGWLEVGDVLAVVKNRARCIESHPWIVDHPHVASPAHYTDFRNTLYVAGAGSTLVPNSPGGGAFGSFSTDLCLTAPNQTRSNWTLPHWFHPRHGSPLSYHSDPDRWSDAPNGCLLKSVAKGQEFVLDLINRPEAGAWIQSIVSANAANDD